MLKKEKMNNFYDSTNEKQRIRLSNSKEKLQSILVEMEPILEHNYQLFNNPNFVKKEWDHLTTSLKDISCLYEYKPPYTVNLKLQQAIPTILQSPNYPDTL